MSSPSKSRRQELRRFTTTGELRQALEGKLSADALDLIVDVVLRYCEPPPRRNYRRDEWDR